MKIILMNKTVEVLVAEYNPKSKYFEKIVEIINIQYAPVIMCNLFLENKDILTMLTKWFRGRGIPDKRDGIEMLLSRLGVLMPEEIIDKSFGLSLTDQYWIKPFGSNILYSDINFFDNDFSSFSFLEATFSGSTQSFNKNALLTPNNTTDGMLKKSWIIENKERLLIKGGYKNEVLQPFNEVLASMISGRLGFSHVSYTLGVINGVVVSKCPCFIDKNTEYVPAYQVVNSFENKLDSYEDYIKTLESQSIKNVREKLENMYIVDFLMLNEDRHLNNFGVIRDVNTLKWLDVAPIFDTGQSLNVISYNSYDVEISDKGMFFYSVDSFDNIIKKVKDIKRLDFSKLDGLTEEFDKLLHEYQNITKMSDERINKICTVLQSRISKLKNLI